MWLPSEVTLKGGSLSCIRHLAIMLAGHGRTLVSLRSAMLRLVMSGSELRRNRTTSWKCVKPACRMDVGTGACTTRVEQSA